MAAFKYLAPALVLASTAYADCTFTTTTTISNPAGASALATCTSVSGNVVIQTGTADAQNIVNLPNIKSIDGSLTYDGDDKVVQFNAPQLTAVGDLSLTNLAQLGSTGFGSLKSTGDLNITNCGLLTTLGMTAGISKANFLSVRNTHLSDLTGLINIQTLSGMLISGNSLLKDITMNMPTVSGNINIGANDDLNSGGFNVAFNNLSYAGSINIQNATNVSLPVLTGVAEDFQLISDLFKTFSAPNLTYAGGLYIDSNPNLNSISLPMLSMVNGTRGAFQIANNSALQTIGGFPSLSTVSSNIDFRGGFTNVSVPGLKKVAGAFSVYSSQDISSVCDSTIKPLHSQQVVQGAVTCTGKSTQPGTTGGNGGSSTGGSGGGSSTGSGSSTSSSAAAVPIDIPTMSVSAGLLAGLLQFLLAF